MKKPVEITEINAAEPDAPNDSYFSVELIRGGIVGNQVHKAGAIAKLPQRAAIEAVKAGAAKPHGVHASIVLGQFVPKTDSSKPKPVEQATVPNIRVKSGSLLQDGRSYGASDGPFHYRGDPIRLLAEQDPIPGSAMETYVRSLSRTRAVIELVIPLGPEGSARLARLRRNPMEAMPDELAAAKRIFELAGV